MGPLLPLYPGDPPEPETPASRLAESGAEYLSDAELLSLLLSSRMSSRRSLALARDLLCAHGGLRPLADLTVGELSRFSGIGRATACAIQSALAMARRLNRHVAGVRPRLETPGDVGAYLGPSIRGRHQEEFHALLLDTKHALLRDERITVGLVDRSQVHAREVFRRAIRESCSRIILVHNHPSGDPTPSAQDIACTKNLAAAGKIVGIEVLDHVIIGERTRDRPREWVSLRGEGLL